MVFAGILPLFRRLQTAAITVSSVIRRLGEERSSRVLALTAICSVIGSFTGGR